MRFLSGDVLDRIVPVDLDARAGNVLAISTKI